MSDLYDVSFKLILQGNHKQDLYLASQTKSRHHRGQLLQLHLSPPAFQKGWIYPDPAHARSVFFLPCFGPDPALDQVHKINKNQSVKQAFAALSTKLSTEICGHDLRCC